MKNKIAILTLLLVVLTATFAEAQRGRGRGRGHSRGGRGRGGSEQQFSIGVSLGMGVPLMDFGKTDTTGTGGPSDSTKTGKINGFAKSGFHFNVNATFMFSENIGATVLIGGNMHGLDLAALNTLSVQSGLVVTASSSHYIGTYLLGPIFVLPVSDGFSVNGKLMGGLLTASYPTLSGTNGLIKYDATFPSASAFAYGGGVGATLKLGDMLGLKLNVDYIGANPTFDGSDVTVSSAFGGSNSNSHSSQKREMATGLLNISTGVSLSF